MGIREKLDLEPIEDSSEKDKSTYYRKSAASLKPKSKAASSVVLESERKPKTRAEKKAAKAEEKKKKESNPQNSYRYEKPTSERYKNLRKLWWVLIGIAVVLMVIVAVGQAWFTETSNEPLFYAILFAGWGFLIAALIVDFGPVRKERKRWEAEHGIGAVKTKAERRLEKTKKAEENARRAKEREAVARGEEIAPVEEEPAKKSRRFWK
ncbi:MAG: hypothetical protein IJJ32_02115 [Eggerthellaceae bacterium]|nr:hypothetical protein [Eggerthellaceae bacterium]